MRRSVHLSTLFFLSFFVFSTIQSNAEIIHVPADYATIQEGIDASTGGDTVLVAPGRYYENIIFNGKRILLTSEFLTTNDHSSILATIIDGSQYSTSYRTSCVLFRDAETRDAILQGFTITGGGGTNWVDSSIPDYTWRSGGAILIKSSSPTIRYNFILKNTVEELGRVDGASAGAILTYHGNPHIHDNVISENTAVYGGGIVVDYSGALLQNNIITLNHAVGSYGGGGVWVIGTYSDPFIIENCSIVNNSTGTVSGGICLFSGSVTVVNSIVRNNTQQSGGQVSGGTRTITYSNIEGGHAGEGNIDVDPVFLDDYFHLDSTSPCIDAGNPDEAYYDPEDPENTSLPCWPSLGTLRNDMGAYGGPLCLNTIEGVMSIPEEKRSELPQSFDLLKSYPNPFNARTRIEYVLQNRGHLQVSIYDVTGRMVCCLADREYDAGIQRFDWDGRDGSGSAVSSGIYLCCVTEQNRTAINRLVLIR